MPSLPALVSVSVSTSKSMKRSDGGSESRSNGESGMGYTARSVSEERVVEVKGLSVSEKALPSLPDDGTVSL